MVSSWELELISTDKEGVVGQEVKKNESVPYLAIMKDYSILGAIFIMFRHCLLPSPSAACGLVESFECRLEF